MTKHPIFPSLRGPCRRTAANRNGPHHRFKTLTLALTALLTFSQTCSPFTTALAESGSPDSASPDVAMTESVNDLQPVDVNESSAATDDVTYIAEHMDKSLVGDGELKANDILTTVTTMVSKDSGVTTIDGLWKNDPDGTPVSERAFEGQYYNDVLLYEAGPDSDYYVARASSLGKKPIDSVAVRNDVTGTVYDDVKVDADNGLVYVPKKYRVTNEDGKLVLNSVRVQLLYAVDDDTTTPIDVTVDADSVRGDIAPTGTAEADILDDQTSINLSDGDNKISQHTIDNVTVNGVEYQLGSIANGDMVEYTDDGNLVVNMPPACVTSVTVNASDNLGKDIASAIGSAASFISPTKAHAAPHHTVYDTDRYINGWWTTNGNPTVGATMHTAGHNEYVAGGKRDGTYANPIGFGPPWYTDDGMSRPVWEAVQYGTGINMNNLVAYDDPYAGVDRTATINAQTVKTSDGVTVTMRVSANLNLYCAHANQPYEEKMSDDKGQTIRIFKSIDQGSYFDVYIGVINPSLNKQSGAGIFKVHWWKPGKISVNKTSTVDVSNNGNYSLAGAKYTVYSDSNCTKAVTTVTLGANGKATTGSLARGTYYVKETAAPKGFSLDKTVYTADVTAGDTTVINPKDVPFYGSILLDKQSSEEVDLSDSYYSLEGAEYGVYSDKDCTKLVKTITTGATSSVETTASGVTTDATTLPLGSTVIMRPNAIADGATYNYVWSYNNLWTAGNWDSSSNQTGGTTTDTSWSFKPTKAGTYYLYIDVTINGKKVAYPAQTITISNSGAPVDNSAQTGHAQGLLAGLTAGTYYVKETKAPKGYSVDETTHEVSVQPGVTSRVDSEEEPQDGRTGLRIVKKSSKPSQTSDNSYYSLEGAEYGVYSDKDCTQLVKSVTTGKDGKSPVIELDAGTYYVKETKAPKGFELDETVHEVSVQQGSVSRVESAENPKDVPLYGSILLDKQAVDESEEIEIELASVDYSLEGAEYGVYSDKDCTKLVKTITTGATSSVETTASGVTTDATTLPLGSTVIMRPNAIADGATYNYVWQYGNDPNNWKEWDSSAKQAGGKYTTDTSWSFKPTKAGTYLLSLDVVDKNNKKVTYGPQTITISNSGALIDNSLVTDHAQGLLAGLTAGTYYVKETKAPKGFELDETVHEVSVQAGVTSRVDSEEKPTVETTSLKIHKSSTEPKLTNGNGCYSLEGAEYGVYSDKDCTNAIGTITTDANGEGHLDNVEVGTYYIKETKAPKGFELNPAVTKVTPDSLSATVEVKDVPLNDPVITRIAKADSLTTVPVQGAEFTVKYYDNTEGKAEGTPKYTWTFASDSKGFVFWDAKHIVQGDLSVLPESTEGSEKSYTFPLGTYTMQETKAPTGYVPPVTAETKISSDDTSGMSQWTQIAKASSPSVGPLYRLVITPGLVPSVLGLTNTFNIDESRAPGIDTVLTTADSSKSSEPQTATLVDHVTMSNLLSGTSYRLDGQLVDVTTGEVLATATTTFKHTAPADDPTNGDNNQDVTFTDVDLATVPDHKVVCYETLTRLVTNADDSVEEQTVAEHKDINDEDQIVTVTPGKNMPETGLGGIAAILIAGAGVTAFGLARMMRSKKKVDIEE